MPRKQSKITGKQVLPSSVFGFYFKNIFPGMWRYISLYMAATFVAYAGGVLWPVIDRMIVGMFENATVGPDLIYQVLPNILLIVALNMGMTSTRIIRDHLKSLVEPGMVRKVSEILTDYANSQSMSFWHSRMSGSVNTDIRYIVDGAKTFLMKCWNNFSRLLIIILNSLLLFAINKYVAYIFVFFFLLRAIVMWAFKNPIKKSAEEKAEKNSTLVGKVIDGFSNQTVVKLFSSASAEHNYLEPARDQEYKASRFAMYVQRLSWIIPGICWDLMLGFVLLCCAYLYAKGVFSLADIVYSTSVYFSVVGNIDMLMEDIPEIIDNISSASKRYKKLVVPIEVTDKPNATELAVSRGKIEFKNVSFKYRNKWILRDFSLVINPGERVGLVGVSGAGKTTLVHLLMRFYDVNKGKILIDGTDIRDVTQSSLRENISFIPQEATMFNRTIRENIAYGSPNATISQIQRAAMRASAHKFIMATDKKYESYVGDRGIKLSGGQRQRIAIARAFLKRSPVLVLDEATSALDSETEVAIQKSFEELSQNRTTIAIAHRLSTLRNMDRIVVMSQGRIIESGTHTSLLRKHGVYAKLWKMQSGGFLQE